MPIYPRDPIDNPNPKIDCSDLLGTPTIQLVSADVMIQKAVLKKTQIQSQSPNLSIMDIYKKFIAVDTDTDNTHPLPIIQNDEEGTEFEFSPGDEEVLLNSHSLSKESYTQEGDIPMRYDTPPPHTNHLSSQIPTVRPTSTIVMTGTAPITLPTSATKALEPLLRYTSSTVTQITNESTIANVTPSIKVKASLFPYSSRKDPIKKVEQFIAIWEFGKGSLPPMKDWKLDEESKKFYSKKERDSAKGSMWKWQKLYEAYLICGSLEVWYNTYRDASLTEIMKTLKKA